jgi:ABC-type nickel/cobalt efflux system permease component RcnA
MVEKLALWQQKLRAQMVPLIKEAGAGHVTVPLITALVIAFGYGVIHAAGPGHGKAVAMSFVLSKSVTVRRGLFFGIMTALFHGFSGVVSVLIIRSVIQAGFLGTFGTVTLTTQFVSFSLISFLGLLILAKNGYSLLVRAEQTAEERRKGEPWDSFLPWAVAIGLVPCPGVVTVLLFCLSMDMLTLGILMAGFISLGMACTISAVIVAVIKGRELSLGRVSQKRMKTVQGILGMISGFAVTALGLFFLLSFI